MRRLLPAVLVLTLFLALFAVPASADDGECRVLRPATETEPEVTVCRQDTWLHQASQKAGNAAGFDLDELPSWDTTKPTGQLEGGAGGGYGTVRLLDILQPHDTSWRPTFSGTYTGVLDNIAVDLYVTSPVYQATGTPFPLLTRLVIDGQIIFEQSDTEIDVPMQPTSAGGGQIARISFAYTNLYDMLEMLRMENGAETEHTIEVSVINRYWGDGNSVIFYDEADVPSGLIFNIEKATGYTPIPVS